MDRPTPARQEAEQTRRPDQTAAPAEAVPVPDLLRLQRLAGNRAVAASVGGHTAPGRTGYVVQRDTQPSAGPPPRLLGTGMSAAAPTARERQRAASGPVAMGDLDEVPAGIAALAASSQHRMLDAVRRGTDRGVGLALGGNADRPLLDSVEEIWYVAHHLYVLDREGNVQPGEARFDFDATSLGPGTYVVGDVVLRSAGVDTPMRAVVRVSGGHALVGGDIQASGVLGDQLPLAERGRAVLSAGHAIGVIVSPQLAAQGRRGRRLSMANMGGVLGLARDHLAFEIESLVREAVDNPADTLMSAAVSAGIAYLGRIVSGGLLAALQAGRATGELAMAIRAGSYGDATRDEMSIAGQNVAREAASSVISALVAAGRARLRRGVRPWLGGRPAPGSLDQTPGRRRTRVQWPSPRPGGGPNAPESARNPVMLGSGANRRRVYPGTPGNFVAESPALANWMHAVQEVLEPRFGRGTPERNLAAFRSHLRGLRRGAQRGAGAATTRQGYARQTFNHVREAFWRREGERPSFAYTSSEQGRLGQYAGGYSDHPLTARAGMQFHHMEGLAANPHRALDPMNIVFVQGNPTGSPGTGTLHGRFHDIRRPNGPGDRGSDAWRARHTRNEWRRRNGR